MSLVVRKPAFFTYAKTKTQISFAVTAKLVVTAKLISAFVFATWILQSLYFLNPKFQASNHLSLLYSPVCVGPDRKPRRPVFSQRGLNDSPVFELGQDLSVQKKKQRCRSACPSKQSDHGLCCSLLGQYI